MGLDVSGDSAYSVNAQADCMFSAFVTVNPSLAIITTNPLPAAMVGRFYNQEFSATGGALPYTWSISGNLPGGLEFNTNSGAITGSATNATTANFEVWVTDDFGMFTNQWFSLTAMAPLMITTANPLPGGTVGVPYSVTFDATGGSEPYTWDILNDSLPDGLGLDRFSGTIKGTPTKAGSYQVTVQVTDDNGYGVSTNATFYLIITGSSLNITTPSPLPDGIVGVGYSQLLAATGGSSSYTWTPVSFDGLSIDASSGAITGIPLMAGIFNFLAQVTDNVTGASAAKPFSLTVTNVGSCNWTITTSVNPSGAGNGGSPLAVVVNCLASVTVTALPITCYHFMNWTEAGSVVSTSSSYSFTATANRTLVANFAENVYSICTVSSPGYGGTTGGGGANMPCGSIITVTASANTGFGFANWTEGGLVVSASPSYTFTVTGNRTLVANFKDVQPPSLAIASPLPGQLWGAWTTANFIAAGTATDNVAVASVWYRLDGAAWAQANGTTNWTTANLSLSPGTNLIQACAVDASGNWSATNSVSFVCVYVWPLQAPPATLPSAVQNAPYNTQLQAVGGRAPYLWSLAPGSASLPPVLSLTADGVLSGIPSTAGTNTFILNVTDALNTTTNQVMTLTVNASTNPPVIMLTALSCSGSGQFQLTLNTTPSLNYTIQCSTNLTDWTSVVTFGGSGGPETITDPNATNQQRYYRVKVGP